MLVQLAHLDAGEGARSASRSKPAAASPAHQLAEQLHRRLRAGSDTVQASRGASNALWAAGKLGLQLPLAWWEDMAGALLGAAPLPRRSHTAVGSRQGSASAPTGRDISNALHGLALAATAGPLGLAAPRSAGRMQRLRTLGAQLLGSTTAEALAVSCAGSREGWWHTLRDSETWSHA